MADDNKNPSASNPNTGTEGFGATQKPLSPEAEAVAINRPGAARPAQPDLNQAKKELDASLAKGREAKTAPPAPAPAVPAPVAPTPPTPPKPVLPLSPPAPSAPPAPPTGGPTPPPKAMGKEPAQKRSASRFLATLGLSFVGLFVVFVILMVMVIASGGEESPVLKAFGIDAAGIRSFLLTIVNFSFGFLAFLFFVLTVIGIFRLLFAAKGDRAARGKGVRLFLIGVFPLFLVMAIWLFLYNYISRIEVTAQRVKAEITVVNPADTASLQAPLEITFSSANVITSLQRNQLAIQSVRWDFDGDGTFETEATGFEMTYLYNRQGNYNVGLAVTVQGEAEPRRYFYPLRIGEAVFGAVPDAGPVPLEVAFDASGLIPQGAKIQSLDWDFDGDGVYDLTGKDNIRPRYTFERVGVFKVHLRFVSGNNLVDNYYRDINAEVSLHPPVTARIEAVPGLSGTAPLQIRFDGSGSETDRGTIVDYEWDFGDGSSIQSGRNVSHIYGTPGRYTVSLTVRSDSGREAAETTEVEIKGISSAPIARMTTTPVATEDMLSGEVPLTVSFDASPSTDPDNDIVDYEWKFDGAERLGKTVEYTFDTPGKYTTILTVRDAEGHENQTSLEVEAIAPGVRALISATPSEGTAPLTVDFDGSSSSAFGSNIVGYEWDFGDSSPKSLIGARITHRYERVGIYTVRLKVSSADSKTATAEQTIYVREVPLSACFSSSRRTGVVPLSVTFDAQCSTGSIASYKWDFGDGNASASRKPAHTFEAPGAYTVALEISDGKNNVSVFSDTVTAEEKTP